jgi:hypothetical protein
VVLNGFAFPRVADLSEPLTRHLLHSKLFDSRGVSNASSLRAANAYPSSKFRPAGMEAEAHLVYPWPVTAGAEPDRCTGAPERYFSADASLYIDDSSLPFQPDQYAYYRTFAESGTAGATPASVNGKFAEFARRASGGGLGNALALGGALYKEFLARGTDTAFVDFCLDSDRGYGFKSWRKVKDISLLNNPTGNPTLVNVPIETDRRVLNVQTDILYPDGSVR